MPAAVTLAITSLASGTALSGILGATLFGVSVATIAGYAVVGGGAFLLNKLLAPKIPGQSVSAPKPEDVQQMVRQAVVPRMRHYGRVKVGGGIYFYQSVDGKLHIAIATGTGRIDALEEHWLNDLRVTLDENGYVTDEKYVVGGTKRVQIFNRAGLDDQSAFGELITGFPDLWTSAYQARGVSTSLCIFEDVPAENFTSVYGGGPPGYRAVLRGAQVFDPRDVAQSSADKNTWIWSDNAALVILDYLTHADGFRIPCPMVNEYSFRVAADVCDETIYLNGHVAEKRYRIWGAYGLNEEPKAVLDRMLKACDGVLLPRPDGKMALYVGAWSAPEVTLDDSKGHVISYEMVQGADALAAFNTVKVTYTSSDHDFQTVEAEPVRDEDAIALAGIADVEGLDLPMVPSHGQAARLAKIYLNKLNPRWRGTVETSMYGLMALGERVIRLKLADLDIDETFSVDKFEFGETGCVLSVVSISQSFYDFVEGEEGDAPPNFDLTTGVAVVPVPTNISASSTSGTINATWDAPPRDSYTHDMRYRLAGGDWQSVSALAAATSATTAVLAAGSYEVQVRAVSPSSTPSDWAPEPALSVTV